MDMFVLKAEIGSEGMALPKTGSSVQPGCLAACKKARYHFHSTGISFYFILNYCVADLQLCS
jgi:hypothetical protein